MRLTRWAFALLFVANLRADTRAFVDRPLVGPLQRPGCDVVIDRSEGSAKVVRRLANGVYELGYPDSTSRCMSTPSITEAFPVLMMGYEQAAGSNFRVSLVIHRSHGTPHLGDLCLLARRFAGWSAQSPAAIEHAGGGESRLGPRLRRWL